jgi:ribosomal protein L9
MPVVENVPEKVENVSITMGKNIIPQSKIDQLQEELTRKEQLNGTSSSSKDTSNSNNQQSHGSSSSSTSLSSKSDINVNIDKTKPNFQDEKKRKTTESNIFELIRLVYMCIYIYTYMCTFYV